MKHKLLCLFLALCAVLALLPASALAADRPAAYPYQSRLRMVQGNSEGNADGLFADLDGDAVPELLLAYKYYDGVYGVTLSTIQNGKSTGLLNVMNLTGHVSFYFEDYAALSIVTRGGAKEIMASRLSYYPSEVDEQYGQLYWNSAEYWFYRYADGKLTQTDHWAYRLHELEDGRYFEDEGGIWHNEQSASAEALSRALDRVTVLQTVSLYDDTDGWPIEALLEVTQGRFADVSAQQYYADPVLWAVERGVTNGTSIMTFSPEDPCTRGQVVTFLWRAAGSPDPQSSKNPFSDVKSDAYYYKAVLWAVEQGITKGTSETKFSPNAPCTRGQVVTFLHRNAKSPAVSAKNPFTDVKSGAYYYDAVLWAVKNGITNGTSASAFSPEQTCTRGQIVTFLYRALADPSQPVKPQQYDLNLAVDTELCSMFTARNFALVVSMETVPDLIAVEESDSRASLEALSAGDAQLCFCRSDVAASAFSGTRYAAGRGAQQDFSVVAALYMDPIWIITRDESLRTVEDLRGKRVAVGEQASDIWYNAMDILGVYGMTEADIQPVHQRAEDVLEQVQTGRIDAAFVLASRPFRLESLFGEMYFERVMMDDAHIERLIASSPCYASNTWDNVPYGMPDFTGTVGVRTLLLARNDVPEEDVHELISTLMDENVRATLTYNMQSAAQMYLPGFAAGVQDLPYHPGVDAYFSSKGE